MDYPDDPLVKRLAFLGKALSERFSHMLAEHDCTLPTWVVLRSAHHNPGLSQVSLAGLVGVEGPTLTRHLDRMCADGLVERRRDEQDRRIIRITLTPAGEQRFTEIHHVAETYEQQLLDCLNPREIKALRSAISTIHRALEET